MLKMSNEKSISSETILKYFNICEIVSLYINFRSAHYSSSTVNVDIFVQLNFHASSPRRRIHVVNIFAHIPVNSICSIMIFFSLTSKALREMCKNMYCAKMSTFTVYVFVCISLPVV